MTSEGLPSEEIQKLRNLGYITERHLLLTVADPAETERRPGSGRSAGGTEEIARVLRRHTA